MIGMPVFRWCNKIRPKDEEYWKKYRGTPKAFITLAAGQKMWANRFGALTAIRYEVPTNTAPIDCQIAVYRNLLANLDPADLGLRFEPVREQALKAAEQGQDFGQLFLGFSLFLVVAALLLMALLFQFGLEQRATEIGTLLALGFAPRQVRKLLLVEGVALALAGGVLGALGGIGYAKAMLWGLTTVWRNAVGASDLDFHATATTLAIGLCASTVVAVLTIWLTLRKQARQPAAALLAGEIESPKSEVHSRTACVAQILPSSCWVAVGAGLAAVAIVGWMVAKGDTANAGAFFGAGTLLLVAGLAAASAWLAALERACSNTGPGAPASAGLSLGHTTPRSRTAAASKPAKAGAPLTLGGLGLRGCARRRKRSLATIALLACGCFVIVAIGVFRLDANQDANRRSSGTGGFALIGQATLPVVQDLNSESGREFFGLDAADLAGVDFVPFRVREGDEASCLNPNRAQRPRLLGVKPELLAGRFTFAKVIEGGDRRKGWELLKSEGRNPKAERRPKSEGRNPKRLSANYANYRELDQEVRADLRNSRTRYFAFRAS